MRQMLYVLAGVLGWATVFSGCTPTLTEVIKQSSSRAELQKNIAARCDALFPTKSGSDTDSSQHYQCTKELKRKHCRYRGGRWHQFTSGCTNRCSFEIARQSGQRMICTMNMPQECLCPSGQCWTGSHCKPLPTGKIKANLRRRQKHNDLVKMYRESFQTCENIRSGMQRTSGTTRKVVLEYARCLQDVSQKVMASLGKTVGYETNILCLRSGATNLQAWIKNAEEANPSKETTAKLGQEITTWRRKVRNCQPDPMRPPW